MRQRIVGDRPRLVVVALALLLLIANGVWIWVHRHGGAFTIDEAGYLSYSLTDYHAWQTGGLPSVIGMALHEQVQPPLVPLLSAATYVLIGRANIMAALGLELLAYGVIVVLTYSITRDLAGRAAGVAAAVAVSAAPIILDYAHLYMYALPAAAFGTVTVWAALRSRQMSKLRWSVVWGVALGAMLISRTMTIAFVPAFVLLGVIHVGVSDDKPRSIGGLACGLVAAAAVAAPWWIVSGGGAWAYLTSFGYGGQSAAYGGSRSIFSWPAWVSFLRQNLNLYIWLPLGLVLFLGAVALAVKLVTWLRRRPRRSVRGVRGVLSSGWIYLAVVVGEGLDALESSGNVGTGFLTPLVPAMFALAIGALISMTARRRSLSMLAVAVVIAASVPSLLGKLALDDPSSQPVAVTVPVLGKVVVVDVRSYFDDYLVASGELDPQDPSASRWRAANAALTRAVNSLASRETESAGVIFAFDQYFINPNTFWLQELEDHGVSPGFALLAPPGGSTPSYSAQISSALGVEHGIILTSPDRTGIIPPVVDQTAVARAATQLGFVLQGSVGLPDHSVVEVWVR